MKDENRNKSKVSWPKSIAKKWFNTKAKSGELHADDITFEGGDEEWSNGCLEREECIIKKSRTERSNKRDCDHLHQAKIDDDAVQVRDVNNYRIFVATWNVGGKSPSDDLILDDWLHTLPPADIFVLGFQEIVPLNAGNVLGTEDNGPAKKWLALIRKTLNSVPSSSDDFYTPAVRDPIVELDADFEGVTRGKATTLFPRRSFQSSSHIKRMMDGEMSRRPARLNRRHSICDRIGLGDTTADFYEQNYRMSFCSSDEDNGPDDSPIDILYSPESSSWPGNSKYCLIAEKQMVGLFLTIWVKDDLRDDIRHTKASCVGRGLMGYLGNKGSISVSMSIHQTSFCFVCSHLSSGQKEGDELRRNSDVMEILKKTRFPRVQGLEDKSPQTILEHDRIIWLGDLNYRIALSYSYAKALVEMRNWRALLENDQLRIEQRRGCVFVGWNEGRIYFPPTYKYMKNSDRYAGEDIDAKQKRRTPAWCDRILWHGRGLQQLSYVRGETIFSDHRPVYSIFLAEVESVNRTRIRKNTSHLSTKVQVTSAV